jgi:disulfide bond formation protein DsbB
MAAEADARSREKPLYLVIELTKHSPVIAAASTVAGLQARTLEEIAVTSNTIANPSHARGDANPALTAALAIMAIAAATLTGAWFMQLVLGIQPCELCLAQRYAYYLVVPLGALIAIAAAKDAPRGALIAGLAVIALATLGNAGLAAYHAGVEWGFWQGPTACTGPVGNLGNAGNLLERLDSVKVVRCDEVQWKFLGLSLAGYDVLISLLMAAIAAWGVVRSARR